MSVARITRETFVYPALTGIVAAGLGVGIAELLTGALSRATTPVLAVGDAVIDRTPGWLRDWAIDTFGVHDKTVLLIGVFTVLALAAAAIGVLARFNLVAGVVCALLLGGVAMAAVADRPDSESTDIVIAGIAGLVAIGALWFLTRSQPVRTAADETESRMTYGEIDLEEHERIVTSNQFAGLRSEVSPVPGREPSVHHYRGVARSDRRRFLTLLAGGAGLAVVAGGIGQLLGGRRRSIENVRDDITGSGDSGTAELDLPRVTVPDGADLGTPGAAPWQSPNSTFYRIDTTVSPPLVHPDDWRLRVHGMVDREIELGFDDLLALGLVDKWVTLCCVSNQVGGDLVDNALWTGVRTSDVLGMAGPHADADAVLSTSQDGWTCGTPLEVLVDGRDSLFAVGMNGEPLPVEHGFPVRMVVPGLYGYVSATKWVVDLEVSRFDAFDAYWTTRGWSERGPVKVQSRIDVPSRGTSVAAGQVPVAGVAWAQHRGIEAVEVRVDDGEWQPADLGEVPTADTWRQWVYAWDATPGDHTLWVRATTSDGEVQTGQEAPPVPDGATGWHSVDVTVS